MKIRIKLIFIFTIIIYNPFCLADSLREAIKISKIGIKAQRERIKIISQNIANEHSTSTSPNENPYRRRTIHFKQKYDPLTQNIIINKITYNQDDSPFRMIYDPTHPAANDLGLVKYPNIDKNIELRDADEARRSIEAGQSAMSKSMEMNNNLLEIIR